MDTGKKNNKFYQGYEDSAKIVLTYSNEKKTMEIWEGFFADMLDTSDLSGNGWKGFTRDYHECVGIWDEESDSCDLNVEEYLEDLNQYASSDFDYQETSEMVKELSLFLSEAQVNGVGVKAFLEE